MQPNKTLFFAIIGLAIALVAGMFVAKTLFADQIPLPNGQEKIAIKIVAAPIIKPWVDQAAQTFNGRNPNTQVEIAAAESLIPISQFRPGVAPQTAQPAAWLAEAGFVVGMAGQSDLRFNEPQSVASTPLTWGAFKDKQDALIQAYGPLSWDSLHAKATSGSDFLTVVIASPQNSAEGLAALISATAAHLNKQSLSAADVNGAEGWLNETFEENTRIPLGKPAEAFAATTGRSIGDLGLLSRVSWQSVPALQNRADFVLTEAQPKVILDFPLAIWADASPQAQETAKTFRAFLLEEAQQQTLAQSNLERAAGPGVVADGAAAVALQRWAERVIK
ncbi:MAG: substrate-binding domain-containing protein [Anaerolineae bacterium]